MSISDLQLEPIFTLKPCFLVYKQGLGDSIIFIPDLDGKYQSCSNTEVLSTEVKTLVKKLNSSRNLYYLPSGELVFSVFEKDKHDFYRINSESKEENLFSYVPSSQPIFSYKGNYVFHCFGDFYMYSKEKKSLIDSLEFNDFIDRRIPIKSNSKFCFYSRDHLGNFYSTKIKNSKFEDKKIFTNFSLNEHPESSWITKTQVILSFRNSVLHYNRITGIIMKHVMKGSNFITLISSNYFLLQRENKTVLMKWSGEVSNFKYFQTFDFGIGKDHRKHIIPIPITKEQIQEKAKFLSSFLVLPLVLITETVEFCCDS